MEEAEEAMEQKQKKKKRVGLTILLVILACIVLIPAVCYAYLAFDHFSIEEMRTGYDPAARYVGDAVYLQNGDVELPLAANDLYWLADAYDMLDSVKIPGASCKNYAVEIGDNTLTLYANGKLFGFLPVPLKVVLSVKIDRALDLTVTGVHLGKWFEIPVEKLAQYGVESHYRIALDGMLTNAQIQSMRVEEGRVVVVVPYVEEFSSQVEPDMTADTLLLYGAGADEAVQCASACYRAAGGDERSELVFSCVTGSQKPVEAMARLLALCDADLAARILGASDLFTAHFLLPVTSEEVSDYREEYDLAIANYNRGLETLLGALREKYKALAIELTRNAYVDVATEEPLSLAALSPQLGLSDDQCHPVLLIATETQRAASTADMPQFSEIPKSNGLKLDMALDYMSYDIGAMLQLPDGSKAMLYLASTGEMVIQCLPQATAERTFTEYRAPKLLNLDLAVFAPLRVRHDAPAPDLNRYIVFLPWDVDAVWSAMQK